VNVGSCAGFRTPAVTSPLDASAAGVGKAPRHEIGGSTEVGSKRPPQSLCLKGWVWVTGRTSAAGVGG
jgi:hypothetical protein